MEWAIWTRENFVGKVGHGITVAVTRVVVSWLYRC